MNIIGTGLSGLVGSRVAELLSKKYSFTNLSLETGIDITKPGVAAQHIAASAAPWVFHFAAMTDVDGAEKERSLGEASVSWKVNVLATNYVAEAAKASGKKLLYISTDFVFDGTKGGYTEEDAPNPQGWYAVTKFEGEKIVSRNAKHLIIRIANPYAANPIRPDFIHKIMGRLSASEPVTAPDDQVFIPTFVDDVALAIDALVAKDAQGLYHVVGSSALSPFAVSQKIADLFGWNKDLISPIAFSRFFAGRAPRPFSAALKNDKITKLGVHMSSFDTGLKTMKTQEETRP